MRPLSGCSRHQARPEGQAGRCFSRRGTRNACGAIVVYRRGGGVSACRIPNG
jgi:hypothetical protein